MGVEAHERALEARVLVPLFHLPHAFLQGVGGGFLEPVVDGRVDPQLGTVDRFRAVPFLEVQPDVFQEIGRLRPEARGGRQDQAGVVRRIGLSLLYEPNFDHPAKHVPLPRLRLVEMVPRRVSGRRLRQPRQHGAFPEGERRHVLAEIGLRRGLHAVRPVPQVDLVQVKVEDLLLRKLPLDPVGENDLLQLPRDALLRGEEKGFDRLLGDRARPLRISAGEDVLQDRAEDRDVIHALVLEEVGVLGGDEGVHHAGGYGLVGHERPLLEEDLSDDAVVPVEDLRRDARPVRRGRLDGGELPELRQKGEPGAGPQREEERGDGEDQDKFLPGETGRLLIDQRIVQ
ncbi:MAG: hypothetical protein H6Q84_3718 [Deltaproteobacteria bacterium]|nr:hypothetical protein [Deltaproteobacteria bacterium]